MWSFVLPSRAFLTLERARFLVNLNSLQGNFRIVGYLDGSGGRLSELENVPRSCASEASSEEAFSSSGSNT